MTVISESAPAKLNLYLHVLGRDQRGYHLLDSLVVFAAIADRLTIAPAAALSLAIDGPFAADLAADGTNLVWRAAVALGQATGHRPDFALALTKNLPVASGIGGGSADAAAALRGLARAWGIAPESPVVMDIARLLGADIPVCVAGRPCFMGGVGEVLDPCPPLPEAAVVLANPGQPLLTKDVFAARQGPFAPEGRFAVAPRDAVELAEILAGRGNGLTAAAIGLCPAIGGVLTALEAAPGCLLARMLGSGATSLGLFAEEAAARAAAAALRAAHPAWWVEAGRILPAAAHAAGLIGRGNPAPQSQGA